ncbi:MAG: alpha/beta hydrolase [Candidatus Omnitrophica bacterium]|nr:alpha/beta hydrolase [Candidatus Omnitrophota bacterium]
MPNIKTESGIDWFYRIEGEGEPLVFLHGWSFDSNIWFRQIGGLHGYKSIVLDLPGHGNSGYKEGVDIVSDLYFIFEELGLSRISLIGHSFGGLLGLKFVLAYPGLVDKIILIGTNAKFVKSDGYSYGLSQAEVDKLRGFIRGNYPDILLVFMRWLFTEEERRQSDYRQAWDSIAKRNSWPQKDALDEFLSAIEQEDLTNELNKIILPALIVCGTGDPICPVESVNYIGEKLKRSKAELFEGCGHLPFLTKAEKFNDLIRKFLK